MKREITELGIFGGSPLFDEQLHVGRPNIGNRERLQERIDDILDRRWLTNNGRYVKQFERMLADRVGVKHCIPICNGTVALEIASRALGMIGEVIMPSLTFVATAHAVQWQESTPVFCDVDPLTHNIDPEAIEDLITPRTVGIVGVHLWGRACNVEALESIARRRGLRLMFDAAHAFGSSYNGLMIGNFGDAEVFSFHATKFLNSLEGGAIATNDDDVAERVRLMKNFGFRGTDNVVYVGTNGKMNEISAAMGITSLESFDHFVATNQKHYATYAAALRGIPGISLVPYDETEANNYQYIIIEVDETEAGVSRDLLVDIFYGENVLARRYFHPCCHRMEPYASLYPHAHLLLPETERLSRRLMSLPTGTAITSHNIDTIAALLRFVTSHAAEVQARYRAEHLQTEVLETAALSA